MKRILSIIAFGLLAAGITSAQEVETIYTNSGNVFSGYIFRQPTVGSHLQFVAEKQFITLPADVNPVITPERKDFERLPNNMQEWLRKEQGIDGGNVTLYRVTTQSATYYDVYVLNDSYPTSFVSFGRSLLNIAYSDINKICRVEADDPATKGAVAVLELSDGLQYKGDILEQYPGVAITFRSDDNITRSIPFQDITAIRFESPDKDKSLLEQIPLYDRVVMKNGMRYVGVITSRNLKAKQVLFQDKDASFARVLDAKEILAYEKTPADRKEAKVVEEEKPLKPVLIDTCGQEYARITKVTEKVKIDKKKEEERSRFIVTTPISEIVTIDTRSGDVCFNLDTKAISSRISINHAREYSAKEMKWNQTSYVLYPAIFQEDEKPTLDYDYDKENGRTILNVTFRQSGIYVICFDGSEDCVAVKVNVYGSTPWQPAERVEK